MSKDNLLNVFVLLLSLLSIGAFGCNGAYLQFDQSIGKKLGGVSMDATVSSGKIIDKKYSKTLPVFFNASIGVLGYFTDGDFCFNDMIAPFEKGHNTSASVAKVVIKLISKNDGSVLGAIEGTINTQKQGLAQSGTFVDMKPIENDNNKLSISLEYDNGKYFRHPCLTVNVKKN